MTTMQPQEALVLPLFPKADQASVSSIFNGERKNQYGSHSTYKHHEVRIKNFTYEINLYHRPFITIDETKPSVGCINAVNQKSIRPSHPSPAFLQQ